jgi:hypothetical protein
MTETIVWALNQIFTKAFWYFVGCSFLGVILFTFRNSYRSEIYKAAVNWAKEGKKIEWR